MDTIAAIATAPAPSAIGVIRVSGKDCFSVCGKVFQAGIRSFPQLEPRKMTLGRILDAQGRTVDNGLAVRFPAPHSYTGEDSAEFHCHGSPVVLREILESLFAAVAGALILGTRMTGREYLGCALMLAAVVLAQLPYPLGRKAVRSSGAFGDGQEV